MRQSDRSGKDSIYSVIPKFSMALGTIAKFELRPLTSRSLNPKDRSNEAFYYNYLIFYAI